MQKKIIVIGEYMSAKDSQEGRPFADGNGKMFKAWMRSAGIDPRECLFTNVLPFTPKPRIALTSCLVRDRKKGVPGLPPVLSSQGNWFLQAQYAPHVERVHKLIEQERPNLVIAAGDLPAWVMSPAPVKMDQIRGRIALSSSGQKYLPIYSMRQVQMDWPSRIALRFDLEKAKRAAQSPTFLRPARTIHISETVEDLEDFFNAYLENAEEISADIETFQGMVTCIGFAPDESKCLVVPFYTRGHKDHNYWRTHREEIIAWNFVARVLAHPTAKTGGQNFQYDMQYMLRAMGIPVPSFTWDTMLLHHALQPELRKSIGFQASLYSDEPTWKHLSKRSSADKSGKKEDE